jgi:hypothetical protein
VTAKSPIAAALAQLQLERANLTARLAKVDEAIVTLGDLFHLPTTALPTRNMKVTDASHQSSKGSNGHAHELSDAIRAALKSGPMAPGELAAQLKIDRQALRYHVKQLEADRIVVSSGTTAARRIALAGRPAKEVP